MYLLCASKRAQRGIKAMLAITVPTIAVFTQPQAMAEVFTDYFQRSKAAAFSDKADEILAGAFIEPPRISRADSLPDLVRKGGL
jgi:hypothetical protein